MDKEFFANRISGLRASKDVSAREMSLDLGQNKSFINSIENKINYPSMENFGYICEYFNITPSQFFDDGIKYPDKINSIVNELKRLDDKQLNSLLEFLKNIK